MPSRRLPVASVAGATLLAALAAGGGAWAGATAWQVAALAVLGAGLVLTRLWGSAPAVAAAIGAGLAQASGELPGGVLLLATATLFCAGRYAGRILGPIGLVAGVVLAELHAGDDSVVPTFFLLTVAFVTGFELRRRADLGAQLTARAAELEAEREVYAELSVRYERARIASELHDIVGHAISVMVIQAAAGQRLAGHDPAGTAEALAEIGGAARTAQADMTRLVRLLSDEPATARTSNLELVHELVARAAATGLHVTLRLEGETAEIDDAAAGQAFNVIREGLTNALRHAPSAAIDVAVTSSDHELLVEVVNQATTDAVPPQGGGGNGLRGLRERLDAQGGRLEAGPTVAGGWALRAWLRRQLVVAP